MMHFIVLVSLMTSCTVSSTISDDVVPDIGQIYNCDLIVQIGDPLIRNIHLYYTPCFDSHDQLNTWVQYWTDNICVPLIDENGGNGGCYGECDKDTVNLCFD